MTSAEIIALLSLILNVLVALAWLTIGLAKIKQAISSEIERHRERFEHDVDSIRLNIGEVAAALRQKVTEVELFTRDTFMRRDSFYETINSVRQDIRGQFEKIDTRLERMEAKIDTKS